MPRYRIAYPGNWTVNIKEYLSRLMEKKTPLILTVNGRAELVVQDAESYQLMLDRLERAETVAAYAAAWSKPDAVSPLPLKKLRSDSGRSMAFRVEITQAFEDLDSIADKIRERSSFAQEEHLPRSFLPL